MLVQKRNLLELFLSFNWPGISSSSSSSSGCCGSLTSSPSSAAPSRQGRISEKCPERETNCFLPIDCIRLSEFVYPVDVRRLSLWVLRARRQLQIGGHLLSSSPCQQPGEVPLAQVHQAPGLILHFPQVLPTVISLLNLNGDSIFLNLFFMPMRESCGRAVPLVPHAVTFLWIIFLKKNDGNFSVSSLIYPFRCSTVPPRRTGRWGRRSKTGHRSCNESMIKWYLFLSINSIPT